MYELLMFEHPVSSQVVATIGQENNVALLVKEKWGKNGAWEANRVVGAG